jgi:hypothetical protein
MLTGLGSTSDVELRLWFLAVILMGFVSRTDVVFVVALFIDETIAMVVF